MTLKHFLFDGNRSKNENSKFTENRQNNANYGVFGHIKCYKNVIFEDSDLKFSAQHREILPFHICCGFSKSLKILGKF